MVRLVPPKLVTVYQTGIENYKDTIADITCEVVEANPPCNISWRHQGVILNSIQTMADDRKGYNTSSSITLYVLRQNQHSIECQPICSEFNVTLTKLDIKRPTIKGIFLNWKFNQMEKVHI